ncbi:class I SAM-dependent methyltransferase [Ectothiorhodospiraceae bacterium BW-2]|nr:class I SAM-dependent methyltransferase [Ectothiorhodospiraceae bacterium BW-2]
MDNSKILWESMVAEAKQREQLLLGEYTSEIYRVDPRHLCYVLSRYKFCSSMLQGMDRVIEVGIGDGFGSPLVASRVKQLICTDIDQDMLDKTRTRNSFLENVRFEYFDFIHASFPEKVDGIFLVDVIEHVFPNEESAFVGNLVDSLNHKGVIIMGTPNKAASQYASHASKEGHVNLKDATALKDLGYQYFNNVFLFGMNDEVLHTGFPSMCHYLWVICSSPKRS